MLIAIAVLALLVVGLMIAVARLARRQQRSDRIVGQLGIEVSAVGDALDEASSTMSAAINALGHVAPKPVDDLAQRRDQTAARLKSQFPNMTTDQLEAAANQILAAAPPPRSQAVAWPR